MLKEVEPKLRDLKWGSRANVDSIESCVTAASLGLSDVLDDAKFWQDGGWWQPIPAVPTSLPKLVQRIAIDGSLVTALAAVLRLSAEDSVSSVSAILSSIVRLGIAFGVAKALIMICASLPVLLDPSSSTTVSTTVLEALRETYFILTGILAARLAVFRFLRF